MIKYRMWQLGRDNLYHPTGVTCMARDSIEAMAIFRAVPGVPQSITVAVDD